METYHKNLAVFSQILEQDSIKKSSRFQKIARNFRNLNERSQEHARNDQEPVQEFQNQVGKLLKPARNPQDHIRKLQDA